MVDPQHANDENDDSDDDDALGAPLLASPADTASLTALMCRATITECKLVPWGSNYTFAVVLEDPAQEYDDTIGIYKPRAGEAPLWDFPEGTLYHREYAAWLVSDFLGWDFIPHTIIRDGPHGVGTIQLYIEPEVDSHYFAFRHDHHPELRRMALFDLVTNNADRKAGHTFRGKHDRKVWGIDHGLTFNTQHKLRTVIWDFCDEPIEGELLDALIRIYIDDDLPELLRPHLDALEIRAFRNRAARLADEAVFPQLMSRRSIPYGW